MSSMVSLTLPSAWSTVHSHISVMSTGCLKVEQQIRKICVMRTLISLVTGRDVRGSNQKELPNIILAAFPPEGLQETDNLEMWEAGKRSYRNEEALPFLPYQRGIEKGPSRLSFSKENNILL